MKRINVHPTVLGSISLAACFLFISCVRPVEQSTVGKVCQLDDGSFVAVEGFLQLPHFLEAKLDPETEVSTYEMFLAEEPDDKSPAIRTLISATRGNKTNRIAELPPDGYTQKDLRIFTASGETVGSSDRVRISGALRREQVNDTQDCLLTTETIERP